MCLSLQVVHLLYGSRWGTCACLCNMYSNVCIYICSSSVLIILVVSRQLKIFPYSFVHCFSPCYGCWRPKGE